MIWLIVSATFIIGTVHLGYTWMKLKQTEREFLKYVEEEEGISVELEEPKPDIDGAVKKRDEEIIRL